MFGWRRTGGEPTREYLARRLAQFRIIQVQGDPPNRLQCTHSRRPFRANRFSSILAANFTASCNMASVFASRYRSLGSVITRMYAPGPNDDRFGSQNFSPIRAACQPLRIAEPVDKAPMAASRSSWSALCSDVWILSRAFAPPSRPSNGRHVTDCDRSTSARLASTNSERSASTGSLPQTI